MSRPKEQVVKLGNKRTKRNVNMRRFFTSSEFILGFGNGGSIVIFGESVEGDPKQTSNSLKNKWIAAKSVDSLQDCEPPPKT